MYPLIRTFYTVLLLALITGAGRTQLLERSVKDRPERIPNTATWGKTTTREVVMKLHFQAEGRPSALYIRRERPGGIMLSTELGLEAYELPADFGRFPGIQPSGNLAKSFYLQAAEHDFTGDGEPELVVAVGNGLTELSLNIFQFVSPRSGTGITGWKRIGAFRGHAKAVLDRGKLLLPYGADGRFHRYLWQNGRFAAGAVR